VPQLEIIDAKVIGGLLLAIAAIHALIVVRRWVRQEAEIVSHFSPKGGCTRAIVAELATARSEILVQAYSFSCPDIAKALIAASNRRVKVVVLLDRSNEAETYSELGDLTGHGLEVLIDSCHAIAHNKVMVIDKRTIITGSFNFTRQAEHENAENLLILRNHFELAILYRANFHLHREHCHAPGKAPTASTRTDHGHHPATTPTGHSHSRSRRAA
jgi:phosphatidylserine/phosphatidylglycerophosphate/cardiolipin synthase-like enzyme